MFEAHVLHLLRRYLGEYVQGLSLEALRISVWKGDVVLRDLKLKTEALNSLRLPVTVKAGFIGTITLKVPWKSLGKEPVIVLIDRVFVLAQPAPDGHTLKAEDREKLFEAKLQQIEEAESATLDAISRSKPGNPPTGNSWLGSLISTIIGNLKISISNVHIRYEDSVSNPGYPFCSGVTLAKLAAFTMDEQGNETFDTSGALDKLRKLLQLDRLAVYHDSNTLPWTLDKKWEDLSPLDWIEVFEDGINEVTIDRGLKWAANRNYLVSPINGILKYHRLGNQERSDPEIPFEKASLDLGDVSLTLTEAQYHDWIKLLEVVSRYRTRVEVSHLRPVVPVLVAPNLWWRYAVQAGLQQKKMCYRFSWERIRKLCQLRRRYIQLYASALQRLSDTSNAEIREIEEDLDSKVILLWRLLAHAKFESVKSKEAAEQKRLKRNSWFSFRWLTSSEDASTGDASEESHLGEEQLTKEEWQAINKLLSYQPDEGSPSHSGKDAQNMIQLLFTVSINQAAARIININQIEIVCGRFEQLYVTTKLKQRRIHCDVLLKFYGLSAPEGSLAQSVCSEQKANALAASFIHLPVGDNVDWKLSATISPCYVTILMESCDRFLEFLRRSNAVSPTITLETAAALQMKFEKVTRIAQEQFQIALEERSRFALDIDLDAPKVRVPIRTCGSSLCDSHFLLDFGHFMLRTVACQSDEQRHSLYSRFYVSGRDISALFRDCGSDCQKCCSIVQDYSNEPLPSPPKEIDDLYPLLDQCGMTVIVDQIKVPHPSYPSTRISIQVPNLGIHFSPARYSKLVELFSTIYAEMDTNGQHSSGNNQPVLAACGPVDLAADARILVWRGIGNSVATWKPCYLMLSGLYIYASESRKSQNYQRYLSIAGKQVLEVPSTNVGGSMFCIALSSRGMDIQKALESSSTWVIEFQNDKEKGTWSKRLLQASYQASAPPSIDILGETGIDQAENVEPQTPNIKTASLVINGSLVEAKLFLYGKTGDKVENKLDEVLILEILASGGKVHIIRCDDDLSVKTKLHSLLIKDELQGRLSTSSQYLACSVLTNGKLSTSGASEPNAIQISTTMLEEDDSFKDALPDFMSLSDVNNYDSLGFESTEILFNENELGKGKGISNDIFYEVEGCENSDFVSVTFLTRGSDSLDYDGIDTQMSIRMSKLEFYCNRPTLVALIGFGLDISSLNYVEVSNDLTSSSEEPIMDKEKVEEKGRVKGFLGYGKNRVVFYLHMNVDSVTMYLNMEDGSQLAMLVQEKFLFDLKVHPSSLSIEGTLGNFRLYDMSLGEDHCWGWLCDIRNPGVESLIKFKFDSYSVDDDDYKGYDYSLDGQLSAVRIIFLYRFVQEITVYFMELATPHTEEAVKLVDKVGDFEWLIQKYEIDGAAAVKLDLSLDTPIIIVPKNSNSRDFIQLDLGQLQVTNEFSWHGFPEKDASAVHVDVLHAEILGINMLVGIDGCLGKPMIQEGQGIEVYVRRSLRDVFRKVPNFSLEVAVGSLHGVMSDKEYKVIVDCVYMNLNEEPMLPPSFRGKNSESKDTMRLLADKVNMNSQILLSRTVTIVAVAANRALLELCNGIQEESPLALIALEGLWVSYRMTSFLETDLYLTIPKFSILDIRPVTKPEMRLMLGPSTDTSKQSPVENIPFLKKDSFVKANYDHNLDKDVPVTTMFLLDYRWRTESQSFVLRVQQPRVLVVPDFLLAVVEFFVPALGTMIGRDETMDPKNDPVNRHNSIILSGPIYKQSEDVIVLSPSRQLIADTLGVDDYTYDGCGKVVQLIEETDAAGLHSAAYRPIIVIGHAKKLRFVNVKIENGSLLRKYAYLGNDSSYSVSKEDDVDIIFLDTSPPYGDEKEYTAYMHEASKTSNSFSSLESDPNRTCSFTFETQVVSPEFTFYDGTKSYLDDLSYGEKLLRAKLDLSFMYASKEKDTWIQALVKDFTIEAGSGLVILDPVDISGGYTSIKDKTNMSLVATDICIHLSLSAMSLILNLQSQAVGAMNFGDALPLVACTNFDQLWVSPRENGSCHNLTFWRPRAPSNYVILGDCVTSRPNPPSQTVIAVSNKYGRVRKPLGFHLIGVFSRIQGFGIDGNSDVDCSIWMPVPPLGYTTLGCVAHVGSQPPPNYVVYCLRSDLVSSTTYSECIFNSLSNSCYTSGFSIWRVDNVVGSFVAHASTNCPVEDNSCDLNHLLKWNSNPDYTSSKVSSSNITSGQDASSIQNATSSGWDILRSISKATNCYLSTPKFERIWWDKGSEVRSPVSIWRPITRHAYAILGDFITEGLEPPAIGLLFKADNPEISAKPLQFTKVAHISGKGFDEAFFWYPIAPPGYAALGCVVSRTDEAPNLDSICCPRMDLVSQANIFEMPISRSSSSKGSQCWSIWKVANQACTFLARADLKRPSSRLAYTIGDYAKPKTHENVTAEIKLRFFSMTVLDSLPGMMKPLFDATITNIKLATHGRLEAMNAVLICSIAASTFNTQLEAWEPLVEPFDGIFKFETYDINVDQPPKLGNRLRIAATSIVNINISASNLETFVGGILSWRRQLEIEQRVKKLNEEAVDHLRHGKDATFSALDDDDFQTVVVENNLGCEIYLRKCEQNSCTDSKLSHGGSTSVWIPPPRFSDRLNVADESREARYYVAVQIIEAKGLPIIDDGNSHSFFCALRLVIDGQVPGQQKLFPQSARTKCVKPFISKNNFTDESMAKWNELFIFEVPRKGSAKLEVEVTNLAAKAGKGEVVGALSFPVGPGLNVLKKVASMRMMHQSNDVHNIVSYPLKKRFQQNKPEDIADHGILLVSASYFERTIANIQTDAADESKIDRDTGFWIGLQADGIWQSVRSLLPLSTVPILLQDDYIAMDVVMRNGKKHASFRGLVLIVNDSDIKLDISICHASFIQQYNAHLENGRFSIVVEEVFENQRYHPNRGWSDQLLSYRHDDPAHWSTRDFSYSSKDFFEPPLPHGCQWTTTWTIDKNQFVDRDGWAYGPDFQFLKWPLTSSKSCKNSAPDAVRRRRWVRTRQRLSDEGVKPLYDLASINPGASASVPWRSTFKDSDQCLLVRPCTDQVMAQYTWGYAASVGSFYTCGKDQAFMDQGLLGRQATSKQENKTSNLEFRLSQLEKKDILMCCSSESKQFWLSIGADASVLHTELNAPVYDWKISVNSPIKLENRLPCPAEFTLWEKTKDGKCIERQHGIILSRGSEHIYSADVQKPIYLTLFVQGGWILEKDPILVLDPTSNDPISSFWMVHQKNKRRLRLSVERVMGGTTAGPKILRFFVPYWIINDSSLSLAYRVVEVEPPENADSDSLVLSRAVKSAKMALKNPINSFDRRHFGHRRTTEVLEEIEDTTPVPSMLSPQNYAGRTGAVPFTSQKETGVSPRIGIALAMRNSEIYSAAISLLELENKERVDVKVFSPDGSYYKLSTLLSMTSDRTKVVRFQPRTLFINRLGCSFCLQQCDSQHLTWIHPSDSPKPFGWSSAKVELLKLRVEGYRWSTPFSVDYEGVMRIFLRKDCGNDELHLKVEVRSGAKSSRYEVIFRPNTSSGPYRIENRSMFLPIRFRQVNGTSDSWKLLLPNATASFLWEDLGRKRLLELLADGTDPSKSDKYDIDEISDHQPFPHAGGPSKALHVTIVKEEKINVVLIKDWMPENEPGRFLGGHHLSLLSNPPKFDFYGQEHASISNCEYHVLIELSELGISLVDHTPEEILYLSVQNLLLAYSTGLGSGISRLKLRMSGVQVDNQLPLTPMPVLFRPQRIGGGTDYILKFSMTMQSNGSLDLCVYPYIGFHGPESYAFSINIHEPIIWRLHEMIQLVNLTRLQDTKSTAVSVDPIIQIGVLHISEVRFKVSMAMSPSQRPRGVLGFWSSLMTALGNTENMPIRINQRFLENVCMKQSSMISNAISNIRKDLLSQPLQLLSGVDILGNASSALGHMSKGVAALSMDKKFIQSRQRQENKGVEDLGDVIREGGGALAKGLFRGVTGILTKPLEGAKTSGVEGFVQGVGKGIIGAAAQPVSGVLDLLSKTTEGANAVRMKIASAITSDEQLLRRRLPRVIGGDNLLRPYDDYKAQGQIILQLAESGSFFGQVDLFKVRGKFALSDAYEDHFLLPKGKILVVTHRRVILMQQPSNIIAQRKFSPVKDPCSVLWDVSWGDFVTMELNHGKKDHPKSPPSRLILYLQTRSTELRDHSYVVKCSRGTDQALQIYSSIDRALNTYGQNVPKEMLLMKVRKPYSPMAHGATGDGELLPKEGYADWSPQQIPASVLRSSTFGSSSSS